MRFDIGRVSPDAPDVAALLQRHHSLMVSQSPPESCHALPGEALNSPDIWLFGLRSDAALLAVGAICVFPTYGEVKSMHMAAEARRVGAGRALLAHLVEFARTSGLSRLNLETGSGQDHAAARGLYATAGFAECPPFGDYAPDPLSVFMTRAL
jgi:putative acetyltransferase